MRLTAGGASLLNIAEIAMGHLHLQSLHLGATFSVNFPIEVLFLEIRSVKQ
jgi:hypothetical protein